MTWATCWGRPSHPIAQFSSINSSILPVLILVESHPFRTHLPAYSVPHGHSVFSPLCPWCTSHFLLGWMLHLFHTAIVKVTQRCTHWCNLSNSRWYTPTRISQSSKFFFSSHMSHFTQDDSILSCPLSFSPTFSSSCATSSSDSQTHNLFCHYLRLFMKLPTDG